MKAVTDLFFRDKHVEKINCNAKVQSRPRMKKDVVVIAQVESMFKQTYKDDKESVGFKTVFVLYRSEKEYILQVQGVSSKPNVFATRYKVVLFESPEECLKIVDDENDSRLYMSSLLLELFDRIQESPYLTDWEKERWEECLILQD